MATGLWCVLLAAAVSAVFWPAADDGFVFDDQRNILENTLLQRGLTGDGVAAALFGAYNANWHPVTWLSHMATVTLFGLDPEPHHVVNIVLHAANATLLLWLLRRWTGTLAPALPAATLFALHPLRVESVAWVSERKDLLCGFFWLAAMHVHLSHVRRPGPARYLVLAGSVALALMSKPMAVTLPLALLLVEHWPLGRLRAMPRTAFLEKLPLLALSLVAGLMTLSAQRLGGALRSSEAYPLPERFANALLSLALYLKKAVLPVDLAIFYPYRRLSFAEPPVLLAAALVLAVSVWALWRVRRAPWLGTGWGWYLLTVAPVLGLVQVGDQALADRYTYLPLIGVAVALAWSGRALWARSERARPALATGAVAALLLCAGLTHRQLGYWDDPELLYRQATRVAAGNWKALTLLGTALERKGRAAEAESSYREALAVNPGAIEAHFNLGGLLLDAGRSEEAARHYREVLAHNPSDSLARGHLALALARLGRDEEARAALEGRALR